MKSGFFAGGNTRFFGGFTFFLGGFFVIRVTSIAHCGASYHLAGGRNCGSAGELVGRNKYETHWSYKRISNSA